MRLKDKVAIITGGSRGIGFATADKFLKEDVEVGVRGQNAQRFTAGIARGTGHGHCILAAEK